MRTDDGEEIVEPGDYELTDGRSLRVYLTQDADETVHMWAGTYCQEVDGTYAHSCGTCGKESRYRTGIEAQAAQVQHEWDHQ